MCAMYDETSDYLSYQTAAAYLDVPIGTLYSWVAQRRVPHHRMSTRMVRFRRSELDAWMDERKVEPRR